ncbi:MAG: HAMP domain-containing sensor histidine kinase [Elusimicrobia bacterium]|nr:HAMP domain-containing sensor histidine kinase [Elusimicrobiota bacterium]
MQTRTEHRLGGGELPKDQRLASYMTHELRAPLTSVHSALNLLEDQLRDRLQPDEKQLLAIALKNTDRLAGLITDILDFSKIQAGKMTVERQPLDPGALLQEAVDSLQAWAITRGVRLLRRAEGPLPRVRGDAKRIVQVLTNLISNAIKFTPAGGRVEVFAGLGRMEHSGTIVFSVKDTGPGVAPEDRGRLFHCLTLAKSMVELQGGRIWVESWKGLGATFRFTIPIVDEDLSEPVELYPKPAEYHGLLVGAFRRLNAVLAAFF